MPPSHITIDGIKHQWVADPSECLRCSLKPLCDERRRPFLPEGCQAGGRFEIAETKIPNS
jgi:hypothetical protein